MKENEINQRKETVEIDLKRVLKAVLAQAWLVALVSVLCAVMAFVGTYFFITPIYKSAAMFYVNNSSLSVGDASFSISSGDLVTSRNLVKSYIVILNSRETLNDVIDYADAERSYESLRSMITAEAVDETEIFQVVVTSSDPYEAEKLANAIAYILPKRIGTIIEGTSAKIVDSAIVAAAPSSPSYTKNTMIGFAIGFLLTVGGIALREIFDITIRTEEDVEQICKHPILASVPDMTAVSKGGYYYYGYGEKKGQKKKTGAYAADKSDPKHPALMGMGISFAASEAYKLLRTKLQFSFTDDNNCRVIGLSSALSGEGKSLTAVNLAYTLSQLGKRVILIDCDMRRPTLAEKLNIHKTPGLSSYLTGQSSLESLMQHCNLPNDTEAFMVIAAGQNPPNPVELLSSERMDRAMRVLRKVFDYVILDLPPVGEVSDAMAAAKETDGMLLVVRQNYCDRVALTDAIRQFDFINSKILGVVFNATVEGGASYGKQRYYKKYYHRNKRYGRIYGSVYANNDRSQTSTSIQMAMHTAEQENEQDNAE